MSTAKMIDSDLDRRFAKADGLVGMLENVVGPLASALRDCEAGARDAPRGGGQRDALERLGRLRHRAALALGSTS